MIITRDMVFPTEHGNGITVYDSVHLGEGPYSGEYICEAPIRFSGGFFSIGHIGAFTYFGNSDMRLVDSIGRFCCIAGNIICGMPEHATFSLSTHPLFDNNNVEWHKNFHTACDDSEWLKQIRENKQKHVREHSLVKKRIVIGNDVWIGTNVIIMQGVTIGDGAVLAAGAVITKDVEPYSIVGGVPARLIRKRFDDKTIEKLLELRWWDYGPDILKGLNVVDPPSILGYLEQRIQSGFPKYKGDEFIFNSIEKTVTRVDKKNNESKLLYNL